MKIFLTAILLYSSFAYSALNMKPGLWKVNMVTKIDGKEMNVTAELQKAMAKMPEAQRTKMMEMMGGKADIANDGAMQVCYSKSMLDKPEDFANYSNNKRKCKNKIITQNSNRIVTNFKCDDGTSGDGTWDIASPSAYKGLVNLTSAKGEKSQMTYTGTFVATDCGKVKPMI